MTAAARFLLRLIVVLFGGLILVWAVALGLFAHGNHRITPAATDSDIVVAIVGGVLLAVALTRPKIAWSASLEAEAIRRREVGLTVLSFLVGGYALASLFDLLAGHVSPETVRLITLAALLLCIYALVVHHEPFVKEGKFQGWFFAKATAGPVFVGAVLGDATAGSFNFPDVVGLALGVLVLLFARREFFGPEAPGPGAIQPVVQVGD